MADNSLLSPIERLRRAARPSVRPAAPFRAAPSPAAAVPAQEPFPPFNIPSGSTASAPAGPSKLESEFVQAFNIPSSQAGAVPPVEGQAAAEIPSGAFERTPFFKANPAAAPAPLENVHERIRRRAAAPSEVEDVVVKERSVPLAAVAQVAPVEVVAAPLPVPAAPIAPIKEVADPVVPPLATVVSPAKPQAKPAGAPLSPRARLLASIAAAPAADLGEHESDGERDGDDRGGSDGGRASAATETIEGTLSFVKEFNGWAVGRIWTSDRAEVRVTGESLVGLKEGLEYSFKGKSTHHAEHGEGFDVESSTPVISDNDDAIERYLVKSFSGIGEAKAAKFVKELREKDGVAGIENLRNVLLNMPWLLDLKSISKNASFAAGEDSQAQVKHLVVTRNLMLRLGSVQGMREKTAKALASTLMVEVEKLQKIAAAGEPEGTVAPEIDIAAATWSMLMLNPYAPIRGTEGYGFGTAELVAQVAGVPRDSNLRLGALVEYAVEQGCQRKGHTFLKAGDFVEAIRKVDPTAPAQKALTFAIEQKLVVVENNRVYSPNLLDAEKSVAAGLVKLMQVSAPLTKRAASDVEKKLVKCAAQINADFTDGFDKDQIDAIAGIMTSPQRLHVLTGGPGTGKTAIMESLLFLMTSKSFAFCAPTGKAAKVLTGRVKRFGYSAVTVHSLLKGSEEGGFKVNEEEPLQLDILVVDENTMNGIGMAAAILAALPAHAHLIVLGDPGLPAKPGVPGSARAGQLPSISPGRFMQDLLLVPDIHHVNLTKTYRNSGGILEVVGEVARGALVTKDRPAVTFSGVLPEAEVGFSAVMQEYLGRVAADGIENTLLVMPLRKGDRDVPGWNTTFANHVLRQTCNPFGERLPGSTLHLGDRIIVRENMDILQPTPEDIGTIRRNPAPGTPGSTVTTPLDFAALNAAIESRGKGNSDVMDFSSDSDEPKKERVVNGDTGTLSAYSMATNERRMGSAKWLELTLDDGRKVWYPGAEAASLQHSYALTVHSAQGSEYTNVMMVVTPGSPDFMNQSMIFTGFSRSRVSLSIHGDDKEVVKIARTPMPPRNSALVERVMLARVDQADALEDKDGNPLEDDVPAEA